MSIKFKVYDTPSPDKEGKTLQHARHISSGTKRMDDICEYISECSSLTSADIKGVLEALTTYVGREISYGFNIELEGFGNFSPAMRSRQVVNDAGKDVINISVDGINFHCAKRLKKIVQKHRPQKIKTTKVPASTLDDRKEQMLLYLQKNNHITLTDYARINNCTHYRAILDMQQHIENNTVRRMGFKTHQVYLLATEEK